MNMITAVLRAAHCKSTHHFFAVDSLWEVSTERGKALSQLLLANYSAYLKGAKDPDNVFKDFENHVVHVADGYWGGAAKTAKKWYGKILVESQAGQWEDVAYSLGVLSHYFSDPFCPLHTAQSLRESAIHRPLEWSICCAYHEIYAAASNDSQLESFPLQAGPQWLMDSIHYGATLGHQHYEHLLDDYNLDEARRNPKLALGSDSRRILAQIFTWVLTAWGNALDAIAAEISCNIPAYTLALPTLLAGVQVPVRKMVQSIESAQQREEVQKILEEYQETGKVVRNLPLEQKTVRSLRQEKPNYQPADCEHIPLIVLATRPVPNPTEHPKAAADDSPEAARQIDSATQRRRRIQVSSPIVDAPAIGPKTAARFQKIGCTNIGEFLDRDADEISSKLAVNWINAQVVAGWQAQARLACQVERLSAAGAGILILAGIENAGDLASRKATTLHRELKSVSETAEGKRILREQGPPPLKTVERWIESARSTNALL